MKVLSLDEFDSMTADLEKTKKDLDVMTAAEKKATDEAAANLSQFKDMEQQKISGDKEQDAMKTTISELHLQNYHILSSSKSRVYRSDLAVLCLVLDEHRRGSFLQFIGTVGTVDDENQLLGDEFVREFRFGRW